MQVVKRILRYLKGNLHFGLRLFSQSSRSLYGHSDSNRLAAITPSNCAYTLTLIVSFGARRSKQQLLVQL